jgi:hypothetical protein
MIFVSIVPFAPKKLFAFAAAVACLSTASCFADAMYLSTKVVTSNEKGKVRQVQSKRGAAPAVTSAAPLFSVVSHWSADFRDSAFGYETECQTVQGL